MDSIHLFDLASSHQRWLAIRQSTIASNVANANTPGFQARDVEAFGKMLEAKAVPLAVTSTQHIGISATELRTQRMRKEESWDIVHSGNSVSLEQEMMKASAVGREHSLNTAIVKSFHRMFMSSVKG